MTRDDGEYNARQLTCVDARNADAWLRTKVVKRRRVNAMKLQLRGA